MLLNIFLFTAFAVGKSLQLKYGNKESEEVVLAGKAIHKYG